MAALLISMKKHHKANLILTLLILISSFQAFLNAFDNRSFFLEFPHLSKISWLLPSLFGPLIYLFAVLLTDGNKKRKFPLALHFIPFLIYLISLLPYFIKSAHYKIDYLSNFEAASKDDFGLLTQLSIPLIFIYLLVTWRYLVKYKRQLFLTFSQIEKRKVDWLRQFVVIVLAILLITAIAFYAEKFNVPYFSWLYNYTYFLVVFLIYWIGYKTLSQPEIFTKETSTQNITLTEINPEKPDHRKPDESAPVPVKYQKTQLSPDQKLRLKNQLLAYMSQHKPYLQPELTIQDLADQAGIARYAISQIINDDLGKNFYDFVNSYRIDEFKRNITQPEFSHLNILAVALESGFNSKATFNNAFKKITGITPSHYVKSAIVVV